MGRVSTPRVRQRHAGRTPRHRPARRRSYGRHVTASPSTATPKPPCGTSRNGLITPADLLHHFRNKDESLAEVPAERDAEERQQGVAQVGSLDQPAPYLGTPVNRAGRRSRTLRPSRPYLLRRAPRAWARSIRRGAPRQRVPQHAARGPQPREGRGSLPRRTERSPAAAGARPGPRHHPTRQRRRASASRPASRRRVTGSPPEPAPRNNRDLAGSQVRDLDGPLQPSRRLPLRRRQPCLRFDQYRSPRRPDPRVNFIPNTMLVRPDIAVDIPVTRLHSLSN